MSGCYALQNGRSKTHLRPSNDANCILITKLRKHIGITTKEFARKIGEACGKELVNESEISRVVLLE